MFSFMILFLCAQSDSGKKKICWTTVFHELYSLIFYEYNSQNSTAKKCPFLRKQNEAKQ